MIIQRQTRPCTVTDTDTAPRYGKVRDGSIARQHMVGRAGEGTYIFRCAAEGRSSC